MKRILLSFAVLLGAALQAAPASADIYQLTCNANPCTTTNNYGEVMVSPGATAGHVTVTVDLTTANLPEFFAGTGAGFILAWNVTGTPTAETVDPNSIVATPNGDGSNFVPQNNDPSSTGYHRFKASPFTGGSCGATTASCFMYAIDTTLSGNNVGDYKLVFDVTRAGGLAVADFKQTTSDGFYMAVDIFRDGKTFNVASNTWIPEPGTVLMMIAGLGMLFMMQRRRKVFLAI